MSVKYIFDADAAIFPSGSFPELKAFTTGSMIYRALGFDDTSVERCFFKTYAASGWSGSMAASVVCFPESSGSLAAVWEVSIDARAAGCTMNGSSFGTVTNIAACATAASNLIVAAGNIDDDGATAGKHLVFLLRRVSTNASDTMVGDMNFLNLIVADGR